MPGVYYQTIFICCWNLISPDLKIVQLPQLFEWRFKAKLVDNENYLNKVATYIALNPIKHWIVEKIEDWEFSSYESGLKIDESGFDALDELEF